MNVLFTAKGRLTVRIRSGSLTGSGIKLVVDELGTALHIRSWSAGVLLSWSLGRGGYLLKGGKGVYK